MDRRAVSDRDPAVPAALRRLCAVAADEPVGGALHHAAGRRRLWGRADASGGDLVRAVARGGSADGLRRAALGRHRGDDRARPRGAAAMSGGDTATPAVPPPEDAPQDRVAPPEFLSWPAPRAVLAALPGA